MNDTEFNAQINTIKAIDGQSAIMRKELAAREKELSDNVSAFIAKVEKRDISFSQYMELLKEFSFSDKLTSPSDLFPGIRTVSEMADPDELKAKTEKMKALANDVSSNNKEIDVLVNTMISGIKKQLSTLIELSKIENQIYDLNMDLLNDMNSVYDIGQLAANT